MKKLGTAASCTLDILSGWICDIADKRMSGSGECDRVGEAGMNSGSDDGVGVEGVIVLDQYGPNVAEMTTGITFRQGA